MLPLGRPAWFVTAALLAVGYSWYTSSPWPIAVVGLYIALEAFIAARVVARSVGVLGKLTFPPNPVTMVYRFTLCLTDRAWDSLELTPEERAAVEACPTRPAGFIVEQWGQSFMRWRIFTTPVQAARARGIPLNSEQPERIVDLYRNDTRDDWPISLWWQDTPVDFRYEPALHQVFLFVKDPSVSVMPDGSVYNPRRVLFRFILPLRTMQPYERKNWGAEEERVERFFVGTDPGPHHEFSYFRVPGRDHYACEDKERGFWWELTIFDLRPRLDARVTRVHKTIWRRQVTGLTLRLDETGQKIWANSLAVEQDDQGRTVPMRGELVHLVLNDDFAVDRIWLSNLPHSMITKPK